MFPDTLYKTRMTIMLIFFQLGKYQKAFEHLGNALTFDPNNYKVLTSKIPHVFKCSSVKI